MPRGGPRPGSGAPRGNLNALKHGRDSQFVQRLIHAMAAHPASREVLIRMARRQRAAKREAERQAAFLLQQLLLKCLISLGNNQTKEQTANTNAVMNAIIFGKQPETEPDSPEQSNT